MATAAVIAGGSILGSVIQGNATRSAAQTQANAANAANQTQYQEFLQQQQNMAPYLATGREGLGQLQGAMPDLTRQFTANDFHQDPGYQFALNQGMQAIQNSAAARGLLHSGNTLKDINNYAQGTADQQYQNSYNRFVNSQQQRYNMMSGLAGMGLGSAAQLNQSGQNYANNVGNNLMGAANANSAATIAQGNNMSSMLSNGANTWMNYNMMNRMMGPSGGGGGGTLGGLAGSSYSDMSAMA